MKKALRAAVAAVALGLALPAAQAATTSSSFNVTVTLTSQCAVTTVGTPTVAFGTYIAFQATTLTSNSVNLTFQCTRGYVPISTAFDTGSGVGVIQGLQYTLTTSAGALTAGTAATTSTIGTGDVYTYTVSGTMPSGQAGTCVSTSCGPTSLVRTLIVTF